MSHNISGFSALQRAENSSIGGVSERIKITFSFQCSSASRKFLNHCLRGFAHCQCVRFQCSSASRKFLNAVLGIDSPQEEEFQCSSASRKFLNLTASNCPLKKCYQFQCSSASRKFLNVVTVIIPHVQPSFQCSSASRKFLNLHRKWRRFFWLRCFSALQRAENSSILIPARFLDCSARFSALQRAENSSIHR